MSGQPAIQVSEELDERHRELAAEAGDAYQRAFQHMADEVANTGGATGAGDYRVGFAQEGAEGLYAPAGDGELEWTEPDEGANCHLEVAVSDAADGRFVPELGVTATLTAADDDAEGEEIGPVELPFLWHPGVYHYGANLSVPGDGTYDLEVSIQPPAFRRHDEVNGDRYAEPVTVEFEGIDVETGRK